MEFLGKIRYYIFALYTIKQYLLLAGQIVF